VEWISFAAYLIGLLCQQSHDDEVYEAARILRAFSFMAFAYQIIRYGSMFETFGVLIPVLQKMVCISRSHLLSHVAQSCYSVIGDKPFLWSKARLRNFVLPGPIIIKLGVID